MRSAAFGLLLAVLPSQVRGAGEVPDPVFWASEAAFVEDVSEGEFVRRLELHLLEYGADPRWRSEWAAVRTSASGLLGEWGSTTTNDLYVDDAIALNVFPAERFQIRYLRRDHQDGRFDVSDQRFEALWHVGPGFGLVLSGWPISEKERASLGGGLRLGGPKSRSALELQVIADCFVWNHTTEGDVRFTRQPLRIVGEGFHEAGPWRVHGSLDHGLAYAATDRGLGRTTRGSQRYGDVEVEWASGAWASGARLSWASLARAQREPGATHRLDRSWGRAVLTLRRDLGRWSISALAGAASQRDELSSPAIPSGRYRLDSLSVGVDGGVEAAPGLVVRLGYLATLQRSRRTVPDASPLVPGDDDAYLDKAHVRAVYTFAPRMAIEALLSQALRGGRFGGGSVKAILVL